MTVINRWLTTVMLQYHLLIARSKVSIDSSGSLARGFWSWFCKLILFDTVFSGQSYYYSLALHSQQTSPPLAIWQFDRPPEVSFQDIFRWKMLVPFAGDALCGEPKLSPRTRAHTRYELDPSRAMAAEAPRSLAASPVADDVVRQLADDDWWTFS